jgi:hypothetical protein
MIRFDRKTYFDTVRDSLFAGKMDQQQVDGQEFILDTWEDTRGDQDIRYLACELATTIHETASTMMPIEEYGKGKGRPYGVPDPVTKETYYGRGFVQLTWKENYLKMTPIVDPLFPSTPIDLAKTAKQALVPEIAAAIMFEGMERGIFRSDKQGPQTLARYFNATVNDPYGAREIINGDKTVVPSWSHGVSIGKLIEGYHNKFLAALTESRLVIEPPPIEGPPPPANVVRLEVEGDVELWINGVRWDQ